MAFTATTDMATIFSCFETAAKVAGGEGSGRVSGAISRDESDERGREAGDRPPDAYPSKETTIDAGEGARGARVSCAIPGRARDHHRSSRRGGR